MEGRATAPRRGGAGKFGAISAFERIESPLIQQLKDPADRFIPSDRVRLDPELDVVQTGERRRCARLAARCIGLPTMRSPVQPSADARQVFLRYASTDRERALTVADALEAAGISVRNDLSSSIARAD